MNMEKLDKIVSGEMWTSRSLIDVLEMLTSFPHRYSGSAEEQSARDALKKVLNGWGIETKGQAVTVKGWRRGSSELYLETPTGQVKLPCLAMNFSAPTGDRPERFEVVDVGEGTKKQIERLADRIKGNAVLVSGDRYHAMSDNLIKSKISTAIEYGAVAYISAPAGFRAEPAAGSGSFDEPNPIPAVTISSDARALIRQRLQQGKVSVRLRVDAQFSEVPAENTIAFLPGRQPNGEIIVGAHFDSHDISPGATDNAASVAVLCEIARIFRNFPENSLRPIRFVFFTGEELGLQGSRLFCAEEIPDPSNVFLYFNLDLIVSGGFPLFYTMTGNQYPDYWMKLGDSMDYPFPFEEVLSRSSDHLSFYFKAIPCLWQASRKRGSRGITGFDHTPHDTFDKVDHTELREAGMVAARLLLRLANEKKDIFAPFEPEPETSGKYTET